jgi:hypothetical protein
VLGCKLRLLRQATLPLDSRQLRSRVSPGDGTLRFAAMDESAKAAGQNVERFCLVRNDQRRGVHQCRLFPWAEAAWEDA